MRYETIGIAKPEELRHIVLTALKDTERVRLDFTVAAPHVFGWHVPFCHIGQMVVAAPGDWRHGGRPPVFFDRTVGLSATRFLRQSISISIGVEFVDLNESDRAIRQRCETDGIRSWFGDCLREAYNWHGLTAKEKRSWASSIHALHRQAIAAPAPQALIDALWERIIDIDMGVYSGEVSDFDKGAGK